MDWQAYFEAKNAVLPLTEGYKYTPQTGAAIQSASEMSAIEKLTVQQFARACNAYKIPQEIFTGQAGLSKDAAEGLISNAVAPLTCQLGQEITRKKYGEKAVKANIVYDDSVRFIEDERVYMAKLFGAGFPMDEYAFVLLDVSALKPYALTVKVQQDAAAAG